MTAEWPHEGPDEFGPYLAAQLQDPEVRTAYENEVQSVAETKPYRQPAYDAVYAVIGRTPPRSTDSFGQAAENARVWRAVEAALDAMEATGLLLPSGTRSVEQFAAQVTLDGQPVEVIPEPTTRERAEARVKHHDRERAENSGWFGSAELVRRQQHTTPWRPVPADQRRSDHDAILEALGDVSFRFWTCPVREHAERNFGKDDLVITVEWRGDVAYCTFPDCKRNSQQSTEEKP